MYAAELMLTGPLSAEIQEAKRIGSLESPEPRRAVPSLRNFEPPDSAKRLSLGRRAMLARKIPTCSPLKCTRGSNSAVFSTLRSDFASSV